MEGSLLNEIKTIELDMLIQFDAVCKKLGVSYFLVGGTLLGAVRHKGFIPWDDDIDVGMNRSDYELFISNAKDQFPDYIFVQNYHTDRNVPFCFTKLRNSNTTFIETQFKNISMNHGVFIDVFPFDYYPDNKREEILLLCKDRVFAHKIDRAFYIDGGTEYSLLGKAANLLSDLLFRDVNSAVNGRDLMYQSFKASSLVTNYCGAWGKKEVVPKQWLEETVKLEFEGAVFCAPKEYDKYLRNVYGDYMQLPPENKRISHHYTECVDLDRPYTCYMNED